MNKKKKLIIALLLLKLNIRIKFQSDEYIIVDGFLGCGAAVW